MTNFKDVSKEIIQSEEQQWKLEQSQHNLQAWVTTVQVVASISEAIKEKKN